MLIPEGREPRTGGPLAFHADFFLVIHAAHASLFDNGYAGIAALAAAAPAVLRRGGRGQHRGRSSTRGPTAEHADPARPVLLSTADHDYDRLRCGPREPEQLGAALTFLFTWGSVPCLYYGDEIGMRYLRGMPDVEGAVCNPAYNRAGCRTPMQWDDGPNAGFSTADPDRLYLPVDPEPDRPTVAAQQADPSSTLHLVRELIALRQGHARARRPGRTRGWCARATRSPTCGAGRTSSSSTRGRSGAGVEVSEARPSHRPVRPGRHHRGK